MPGMSQRKPNGNPKLQPSENDTAADIKLNCIWQQLHLIHTLKWNAQSSRGKFGN